MFRLLRTGNPYNVLLLLIYAIVIKYYYLLHGAGPVIQSTADGWLYPYIVHWLQQKAELSHLGFSILVFIILFIEALLLNSIFNRFRILQTNNFFPAFCFLLFSSFFKEWNVFSAPLITNFLMLAFLYQSFQLYSTPQSRSRAFSMGFITGLASLLYMPAVGLLLLIWIALLLSRPFHLAEWILAVTGIICPYYFLFIILFLAGRLPLALQLSYPKFGYPHLETSYWMLAGMILLIWWFLYGSLRLQKDYMKMLIHIRKCWQILLAFVCVGLILPFLPDDFSFSGWQIAFLPITAFLSFGFLHIRRSWVATLVHVSALAYLFLFQWVY